MTQNRNEHVNSPAASPSFTALTTLLAFKNALGTEYGSFFSIDEINFINHMIATAIAAEPDYLKWGLEKTLNQLPYRTQRFFFDQSFAPAYAWQKLGRKLMIKFTLEKMVEHLGLQQVVFLSGGYDSRGYMLSKNNPALQVFELDRGKTRAIKVDAFRTLPGGFTSEYKDFHYQPHHTSINQNYHLIECDFLSANLIAVLTACGFDPNKKTFFVAEGLTMYLPEQDNARLLDSIFHLSTQTCGVLLSYRSRKANQALGGTLQNSSQENYLFSLHPEQVADFVGKLGFTLVAKQLYADLLDWVHSNTLDTVQENGESTAGREHYYFLEINPILRNVKTRKLAIDDLPLITRNLPEVIPTPTPSSCTIV